MKYSIYILAAVLVFSCSEIFEEDISTENIQLILPSNDYVSLTNNQEFYWEEVIGVDEYSIKIATPSFNAPILLIEEKNLTESSISLFLEEGNHEWFVKGENSEYEINSDTFSLTVLSDSINDLSSKSINVIEPANSLISPDSSMTFSWNPVVNSSYYLLQIATPDFTNLSHIVIDEKTALEELTVNLQQGEYEWRIRAENNNSVTPYSLGSLIIDYTSPSTPQLLLPRNQNAEVALPALLKWSSEQNISYDSLEIYYDTTQVPIISKSLIQTEFLLQDTLLADYYWRVLSVDDAGNQSNFTAFWTFKSF